LKNTAQLKAYGLLPSVSSAATLGVNPVMIPCLKNTDNLKNRNIVIPDLVVHTAIKKQTPACAGVAGVVFGGDGKVSAVGGCN